MQLASRERERERQGERERGRERGRGREGERQEPPSLAIRSFYADTFEITIPAEREQLLKVKNERILEWRRAQESGVWEISITPSDVWKYLCRLKKGKSSLDGVTAEMLLALLEEQILRLARNIQDMFHMVSGQGVSHSLKTTCERPQRVPSHQLLDHIS